MKVEKTIKITKQYNFAAPIYNASLPLGLANKECKELKTFDISSYLITDPENTYLVQVSGDSMIDEGIFENDILVVSRNEEPADGKVVIAALNGEMAVKTYRVIDDKIYLFSANKKFLPIEIKPFWEFDIQGVVKHVIKKF